MGLKKESLFIGTRDYSALLSSAAAIRYLQGPAKGIETRNRDSVLRHSKMLREAWGSMLSSPLPPLSLSHHRNHRYRESTTRRKCLRRHNGPASSRFVVNDIPGTPEAGVRDLLRDTYGVEAALGNFKEQGNYVRLSCCSAYNTDRDYEKLRDAILDILESQQRESSTSTTNN